MTLISVRGLTYTYPGAGEHALRDVSIDIGEGEVLLLVGESGSGKSTLAHIICGLQDGGRLAGGVLVQGREVASMRPYELSGIVGLVQQDPDSQICTLSVEDEVAFGLENHGMPRDEMHDRVRWALGVVGGSGLMGRDTITLSGGEKQKVAIAAALALRPRLIILDEPTANLDPRSTGQVLDAIKGLIQGSGATVMIIEHRIARFLPLATRVAFLSRGRLVGCHAPDEALGSRKVLEEVGMLPRQLPARSRARGGKRLLSVRDLTCTLGSEEIIRDVSFDIRAGEVVALMGDNGSGKTTLLLSLMNLSEGRHGRVFLDGRDVSGRRTSRLARSMGMVFQSPSSQLFESTVEGEVGFAPRNFGDERAKARVPRAIEFMGLRGLEGRQPHSLSHGQKRRVNLASVMVYGPKVLLLDEAFIGQDVRRTFELARQIRDFASRGGAALMVLHDPEVARRVCDRIIFLEGGRVVVDSWVEGAFELLREAGEHHYLPSEEGGVLVL